MPAFVKFNYREFNAFRSQAVIQAELHRRAEAIRQATGSPEEFEVVDSPNKSRARTIVITSTYEGKKLEATDHVLTQALDAGRG
jgi:hypothetical protein